jgi:hypothetical protein
MVPPINRTAGFPQYGWKVGLSGNAFPRVARVKPAPGMPLAAHKLASTLRALCGHTFCPALCQDREPSCALPFQELAPVPQRPCRVGRWRESGFE